jgi:hypothetical protein
MKTKVALLVLAGINLFVKQGFAENAMTNSVSQTNEPSPFKIIVTPRTNRVHIGELFKVGLEVKNVSNTNQSFDVWSCSWYYNWESSNPAIGISEWACLGNYVETVNLRPGESFKETIKINGEEADMRIFKSIPTNTISFRMAFHTGGDIRLYRKGEVIPDVLNGKLYWSDELNIKIYP